MQNILEIDAEIDGDGNRALWSVPLMPTAGRLFMLAALSAPSSGYVGSLSGYVIGPGRHSPLSWPTKARRGSWALAFIEDEGRQAPSEKTTWWGGVLEKIQSQGRAGGLALLAETILFWLVFLLPATVFLYHQQYGQWLPDRSDPEEWASFTSIFGSCYVFCKIPPIEAARWAWVFAWTPWFAKNVLGETAATDDDGDV